MINSKIFVREKMGRQVNNKSLQPAVKPLIDYVRFFLTEEMNKTFLKRKSLMTHIRGIFSLVHFHALYIQLAFTNFISSVLFLISLSLSCCTRLIWCTKVLDT